MARRWSGPGPMSDAPNSQPASKKELSMEVRLVIAFALMGIVLFATPYLFKSLAPPAPPKKTSTTQSQKTSPEAPVAAQLATEPAALGKTVTPAQPLGAGKEETFIVETDFYKVIFSNRGAVIQQWILKKYTDDKGKPLELVNSAVAPKDRYPFQLEFDQKKPAVDLNNALFAAKPAEDGLGITYEYAGGAVTARKTFHF